MTCCSYSSLLRQAHPCGMTGDHLNIKRTLDQVRQRAYGRGGRRDVRQFCRQCNECNSYFRGTLPRSAPLQPMLTGEPLQKLHIDTTVRIHVVVEDPNGS